MWFLCYYLLREDKCASQAHKTEADVFVKDDTVYFLVDSKILPEIFKKVLDAKRLLKSGKCKTASEAAEKLKISRSAFYKYKDCVFPVEEAGKNSIITLFFEVADRPGVLSHILKVLASAKTNVLTINQTIPVDGGAIITISLRIEGMDISASLLLKKLRAIEAVKKAEITSGE